MMNAMVQVENKPFLCLPRFKSFICLYSFTLRCYRRAKVSTIKGRQHISVVTTNCNMKII